MVINDFTNTNFVILAHLYDEKDQNNVVKITQDEVAEHLGLSRVTINKAFALFVQNFALMFYDNGYLQRDFKHVGRYYLTDLGCKVVEIIRTLSVEANMVSAKEKFNCADVF